jgi:hypothetical protein
MNKPPLSNFFIVNQVVDTETLFCFSNEKHMPLHEYSEYKSVKGGSSNIDDPRTICQMLRNANGLTDFEYHKDFILLVNFANNAVIKLGNYSKAPGNDWEGNNKSRSEFTEDKRVLGQQYLDHSHHSVFELLKKIKDTTTNERAKDYLVEISYYFERVNAKILEYEQKENQ